jgi:hypothetical protein
LTGKVSFTVVFLSDVILLKTSSLGCANQIESDK